jgi:hypothetical protein
MAPLLQPSFVGGEESPVLRGRVDLERYRQSLERCENFVVHQHGGVHNRQGTEHVQETKLQNNSTVRLIPFAPSVEEGYVLEFGHLYLRFYDSDGLIYTEPNQLLQSNISEAPQLFGLSHGSFDYPFYYSQSFVGDAAAPFEIGKLGFRFYLNGFGSNFINVKFAIFNDNGGEPGTEEVGLGFDDFQSMADIDWTDIPQNGTTGMWKYFFLRDPGVGGQTFPLGTVLHIVVKLEPFNAADYPSPPGPGSTSFAIGYTQSGDKFPGGYQCYKYELPGSPPWVVNPLPNQDMEFAVFNNDIEAPLEITTPWTATIQDEIGSDSEISRLTYTQSVDVMTICDGTGRSPAYELKRTDRRFWILDTLKKFESVGAPSDVVYQPAAGWVTPVEGVGGIAPYRDWTYAVSGVDASGKESLPFIYGPVSVGANISVLIPLRLQVTIGTDAMDHYVVYKGLDGTYGFIGTLRSPRTAQERYDAAYSATYSYWVVYFWAYYNTGLSASNVNTLVYIPATNLARTAGAAAAAAEGVIVSPGPGTTTLIFMDDNLAPDYTDQPRNGANQFTPEGGYKPRCVSYFQQRLCFANVSGKPDTIFMSEVSNFDSFQRSVPTVADDAIEATLAQGSLNEIRYMVQMRDLLVLTTGAEHILSGAGKPVAPDNLDAAAVSNRGCGTLHPLVVGNVILFKDIGGHIREWVYEQRTRDYPSSDVGVLAEHLFRTEKGKSIKITEWCYVSSPQPVIYAIRADGVMLSLTYNRDQSVAAWARHTTDGKFRSIATSRNIGTEGETVHVVVDRVVGGVKKKFVERITTRDESSSPFSDCAISTTLYSQELNGESTPNWAFQYGGSFTASTAADLVVGNVAEIKIPSLILPGSILLVPTYPDFTVDERWIILNSSTNSRFVMKVISVWPGLGNEDIYKVMLESTIPADIESAAAGSYWQYAAKVFGGLDHLIGETVTVRADEGHHPDLVVDGSGNITLEYPANFVAAGIPFESTIKTLPLALPQGDAKTNQKLVSRVSIDVYNTSGLKAGISEDELTEYSVNTLDDPTTRANGRIAVRTSSKWERTGQVLIRQSKPLPATILTISPEVTIGG